MPHGYVQYQIKECNLNLKTAEFQAITINQFLDYIKFTYPDENIELIALNVKYVTDFLKQQEDKGQQKSTIYRKQLTLKKFFNFLYKTRQLPVDILYDYNYFKDRALKLDKKYQSSKIDYNYPMLLEAKQKVLENPKIPLISKQLMVFYLHGVQLSDMFKLEIKDCSKEVDDAGNTYYAIFYTSKQGDEAAFKITAPEDIAVLDQSIEIAKERSTTFLISRKTKDTYEQSSPFLTRYYIECINETIGFNLRSDDIRIVYVNYLYREKQIQIDEISRMLGRSENNILKIVTQYVERLTRNDYKELTGVQVTPKKELNKLMQFYIENYLTVIGNERFETCDNYFEFLNNRELNVRKGHKSNNCANRFCPICAWNTVKKDAIKISVLLQAVREEKEQKFIMLTLTTPNCSPTKLKDEIDKFNKAFKKLFNQKNVKNVVNGYMCKLEITTDQEPTITKELYKKKQAYFEKHELGVNDPNPQYNTYNPHFYVIVSVNKNYFTDTKLYFNRDKWLKMWKESMNDENNTQMDVQKVHSSEKSENGAVLKIAKYSAKGNEIYHSKAVFDVFYRAMKGRQLLTYNGLFKEYLSKFTKGELDKYKKKGENEYTHLLQSFWKSSKYENVLRKLSKEELEEYNQHAKFIEENDKFE